MEREGDGEGALYRNILATATVLDRSRPGYVGGILELWDKRNDRFWVDIADAFKTGKALNGTKEGGTPFFEIFYADPARQSRTLKSSPRSFHYSRRGSSGLALWDLIFVQFLAFLRIVRVDDTCIIEKYEKPSP